MKIIALLVVVALLSVGCHEAAFCASDTDGLSYLWCRIKSFHF